MATEREGGLLVVRLDDNADDLRIIRHVENMEEARRLASEKIEIDGIRAVYILRVERAFTKS